MEGVRGGIYLVGKSIAKMLKVKNGNFIHCPSQPDADDNNNNNIKTR